MSLLDLWRHLINKIFAAQVCEGDMTPSSFTASQAGAPLQHQQESKCRHQMREAWAAPISREKAEQRQKQLHKEKERKGVILSSFPIAYNAL